MTWSPLQLRKIVFLGPSKPDAYIDFKSGLNVICGASDTGKSFIVETINFLLGGSEPLRDIPERIGYDICRFSIIIADKDNYTFERSVEGGGYEIFDGLLRGDKTDKDSIKIKSKHVHGKEDNISGWLLSKAGLLGKRIRKNAKGETQSLSFRNLVHLIIVQEDEIIKINSPFLTGQYTTKTSDYSALKLLLTGLDDSAWISGSKSSKVSGGVSAKVELIDKWVDDLRTELEGIGVERKKVEDQLKRLDNSINTERESLEKSQKSLNHSINLRRELYSEREKVKDRISEIHELLDRFELLDKHYKIDIERLAAIKESGSLFVHQKKTSCPLCGALPEHQHVDESCGGDVETVVQAAIAEIEKIMRLSKELNKTVDDLCEELEILKKNVADIDERYTKIDADIRKTITPDVGNLRTDFSKLVDNRSSLRRNLDIFNRLERLEEQKKDLLNKTEISEQLETTRTVLSKTVLDEFAECIKELLKAWNFPDADRVHFDEKEFDFVINGKPRASRGKGLRAITHAAATIGLMEYCKAKSIPHPGFVVIDSPLLSYWAPEGEEDSLKGTDVKDKFYEYLATEHSDSQIIIIENEHPPDKLIDKIAFTDFTKNPNQCRYGFFPYK